MKYRVIIKVRWNVIRYEFKTAIDAMTFMDAASRGYVGCEDKEDEPTYKVYMEIVKEEKEEEEKEEEKEEEEA